MDPKLVYAKTPTGDEAVRQRTRVVQRNLRMVLIMVDGKLTVDELAMKVANHQLVESALKELEEGGFIAPTGFAAASAWIQAKEADSRFPHSQAPMSALSQFVTTEPEAQGAVPPQTVNYGSGFSAFIQPDVAVPPPPSGPSPVEKLRVWLGQLAFKPKFDMPQIPGLKLPMMRVIGLGVGGLVALGFATLLFYPYDNFRPELEAAASKLLQEPVKVGEVSLGLLPSPHLKLASLTVGERDLVKMGEVRVFSPFSLLKGGAKTLSMVAVSNVQATPRGLLSLPLMGSDAFGQSGISIRQIRIEKANLSFFGDLALSDAKGELGYSEQGALLKATFESSDRTMLIEAKPGGGRSLAFSLEGRAWRPGSLPISFDSMQANGVLTESRLAIQNVDTTFLGGVLKGNWLLDWSSNGLAMAGEGSLTRVDGRKVSAALAPSLKLEGDVAGPLRFRSSGKDWGALWANIEGTVEAEITRGLLAGVDLGEASRRGQGSVVRGGATKFDRLRVALAIKPNQLLGRGIQLDAGAMTANGQFSSDRANRVEAVLNVNVQSSVSSRRFPVQIEGKLPDLTVTLSR